MKKKNLGIRKTISALLTGCMVLGLVSGMGPMVKTEAATEDEVKRLPAVTYDLSKQSEYLLIGEDIAVNGEAKTTGDSLTAPGNYIVQYTANGNTYRQSVALYLVGDVDLDGTVATTSDLTCMQNYVENGKALSDAARLAADINNDNVVDMTDLELLQHALKSTDSVTVLEQIRDKYHVPAVSYDFIGGDEVMPITGFFGPFDWPDVNENDLLQDEVFQRIKDVGVNLISYTPYDYWNEDVKEGEHNVERTLDFTDKYGIGYYLCDDRLNTKYGHKPDRYDPDAEPNTPQQTAEYLSDYAYHPSYLGANIIDEPSKDGYAKNGWPESRNWKTFKDAAVNLNRYVNYEGYINHCPEDAPWFLAEDDVTPDINLYSEYWDQFIAEGQPHLLSIDDYPFTDRDTEDVTNAKGYFTSLLTVRQKALDSDLPFWTHVQAGGQFKGVDAILNGTSTAGERATEAETYWNVNTCLAAGSKGIGWFTLVQYNLLVEVQPGVYDLDMNSLIDLEGNETPYYPWAKKANRQIQACDEVLMKSQSKGIIATEGYAWTEIKEAADYVTPVIGGTPLISTAGTTHLKNVVAEDKTYGAMIGCFDYKDTEAFYVVNYNTTANSSQKITLSYKDRYRIRIVQDGVTTYSETDQSVLNIPAGEAVLIVVEEKVYNAPNEAVSDECYEISHRDFVRANGVSLEDKSYHYTTQIMSDCASYAPISVGPAPSNLDGTMFSADVTYHGTSYIRYGGTDPNGWMGLEVRPVNNGQADYFEVRYIHTNDGVNYADYKTRYVKASTVGMDSVWDETFHLQISMRLVDHDGGGTKDDIEAGIYINGNLANGEKFYYDGYGAFLGNRLGIISESAGGYVTLETHEFEAEDYTCITTSDIGVGNTNQLKEVAGVYAGTSMDKVAFSSYVDFGTDGKIHFAGTGEGEKDTITLYRYTDEVMAVDTKGLYTGRGYAYDCIWGIPIPTSGKFHLLITTEFIDYDRDGYKEDLRLRFWIDGKAVFGNIIASDGVYHMGNHVTFSSSDGSMKVQEAPMKETLSDAFYNLTDIGEYQADANTVYDKPGEYPVEFDEGYTHYKGNVVLYRQGDANLDDKVTVQDLIRQKATEELVTEKVQAKSLDVNGDGAFSVKEDGNALRELLIRDESETTMAFGTLGNVDLGDDGDNFKSQQLLEQTLTYHKQNEAKVIVVDGVQTEDELFGAIVEKVYKGVPERLRPQFVTTQANAGVTVNGYTFVSLKDDATVAWLSDTLEEASRNNPTKPIFVATNQTSEETTVYEDVLKEYPQVVLLTSEAAGALEGDSGIYQEDYTTLRMGTLTGNEIFGEELSQAIFVRAVSKKVDIQKYDALKNSLIESGWAEDDVFDKANYTYTAAYRAGKNASPEFPENANVSAVWNEDTLSLEFDAARDDELVYYYELTGSSGKVWKLPGISRNSKGVCKYQLQKVDKAEKLEICAVDAYGNRSEKILIH